MQPAITQPVRPHLRMLVLLLGSAVGASAWAQVPVAHADTANSYPAASADAAYANSPMGPASNPGSLRFAHGQGHDQHATAVPWSQLSVDQRNMLAPLQSQWDQLPPRRQQRLAQRAQGWAQLPPARRQMIGERLQHWAQMSPQQRQAAARGAHAFQNLSDADRQRLMDTYRRFQALPPQQRRTLMHLWREQHPTEHGFHKPPMR